MYVTEVGPSLKLCSFALNLLEFIHGTDESYESDRTHLSITLFLLVLAPF